MSEKVFIILKPDAVSRDLTNIIVERFKIIGEVAWVVGRFKSREWCRKHYEHIASNPGLINAYAIMEAFMCERLLIGFSLRGNGIIEKARIMAGATRVHEAAPGTIRGDFGVFNHPICYNLVHVADSPQAVLRETDLFLDRRTDYDFGITTHRPHQSQTECDNG